jgi:hypothetical protein
MTQRRHRRGRLEEITVGASVIGIVGSAPVNIVAVRWHGSAVIEAAFYEIRRSGCAGAGEKHFG